LFYKAEIDLLTALAGGRIAIEHLDERWLNVVIKPGEVISPGEVKVVKGQGMPSYRHHDYGDLFIQFDIKFPPNGFASLELLEQLGTILPPRNEVTFPEDGMVEDVNLDELDAQAQARAAGNGSLTGDDEDEEHTHERVQCASQ